MTKTVDNRVLVQLAADINLAVLHLLEMAFQTEIRAALSELFGVDAAVRRMATGAALAQRGMFKHERPGLRRMTLQAGFILSQ